MRFFLGNTEALRIPPIILGAFCQKLLGAGKIEDVGELHL